MSVFPETLKAHIKLTKTVLKLNFSKSVTCPSCPHGPARHRGHAMSSELTAECVSAGSSAVDPEGKHNAKVLGSVSTNNQF